MDGLPTCNNTSMVNDYQNVFANVSLKMDTDEILEATKCLLPCSFLEYKVISIGDCILKYCNFYI